MTESTYYSDHWKEIEPERKERYERMFAWRDEHVAMFESLNVERGCRVLDYGCGPGFMSLGLGELVGPTGRVFGVDLNAQFVADANKRADLIEQISYLQTNGLDIPLPDRSVNRVFCKNVLEYVPDPARTMAEFSRVLEDNGRLLIIDSDWRFVFVEPWGAEGTARFFDAASVAFKTPEIGRTLVRRVEDAGFTDVDLSIRAGVDRMGGSLAVLQNMASYARETAERRGVEIDELLRQAEAAVEAGTYMFCLPQFYVVCTTK